MLNFIYESIFFLLGLAAGSFLNVVILRLDSGQVRRLETGEGIIKSRSHCPKCGQILRWYDLMPVLSFVLLAGKCRYCRQKISWQYPIIEIATGSLFLLIFLALRDLAKPDNFSVGVVRLVYYWFIVSSFIVIFVYDLKHYLIPDKIIFPAIGVSVLYRIYESVNLFLSSHAELVSASQETLKQVQGDGFWQQPFFAYLLAAFIASVFFLLLVLITKGKGMGLGDVKLSFLMGLVLGWPQIFLALFLAFLSGALVGLGFIAFGKKTLKSQIPFGPFLASATIFVLLFGSQIISTIGFGL